MTDTAERRQHHRKDVELDATIERISGRSFAAPAATIDLSEGGARLTGPAAFGVGDVVRVTITTEDISVENQGLIVGRQPGSGGQATLNVAFRTPDEEQAAKLRRVINSDSEGRIV